MFGELKSTKTLRLPPKAFIGGGGGLPCRAALDDGVLVFQGGRGALDGLGE